MEVSKYERQFHMTKICIDSYNRDVLEGRVYHSPEFEGGILFHSTMEFLKIMEYIGEKTVTHDYVEKRTFQKLREIQIEKPLSAEFRKGKEATFIVRILFRQHASWQGTVMWCDKGREERFQSALELLLLMDSSMQKANIQQEKIIV